MIEDDIFAIPKDILFPDELSRYLRDKIAVFAQENAFLKRDLVELEHKYGQLQNEAEDLKVKLQEVENPVLPQFAVSSQNISSKIVELSKSYREKCSELEKYKTKCSKLITHLEEYQSRELIPKEPPKLVEQKPDDAAAKEKLIQEKLTTMTNKMLEFKNLNMQLKNDLRQASKLLQQEVGEDFRSLQANSSWKGRAQIICDLQEKNKKLKEKLKHILDQGVAVTESPSNERISSKLSILEKENLELKSQLETYKSKSESLKSRCHMLESEHHSLKLRIQDVKERSSSDLDLISSMSKQLAEAEHVKKSAVKEKEMEISKLKLEMQNYKAQIENYKTMLDKFKSRKDDANCEEKQPDNCKADFVSSSKNFETNQQEGFVKLEEQKLKLLELVKLHKKKIEEERAERQKCEQLLRIERQKSVKLESAMAKSELDSAATNRSRYSNITHCSRNSENSLRDQLELAAESIKALQTRLQLEQNERKQDFQQFASILSTTKH